MPAVCWCTVVACRRTVWACCRARSIFWRAVRGAAGCRSAAAGGVCCLVGIAASVPRRVPGLVGWPGTCRLLVGVGVLVGGARVGGVGLPDRIVVFLDRFRCGGPRRGGEPGQFLRFADYTLVGVADLHAPQRAEEPFVPGDLPVRGSDLFE